MTIVSRLSSSSEFVTHRTPRRRPVVPLARLLQALDIEPDNLTDDRAQVQVSGLRQLLSEFARQQPFDPEFYAESYPDLEAARLAGVVSDLHVHFVETGFFEGRLPSEPPFDAVWYATFYPDLTACIDPTDSAALRNHFLTAGLAEGRVGTEACFLEATGTARG